MWAIKTDKGELLVETISDDREGAYWSLFDLMDGGLPNEVLEEA